MIYNGNYFSTGITKDKGFCIADPVDFTAFKELFIQLDLPYKAVRLEHFNVKATIFNYGEPGNKINKTKHKTTVSGDSIYIRND